MTEKNLFNDIAGCMQKEMEKSPSVCISEEVMKDFFTDDLNPPKSEPTQQQPSQEAATIPAAADGLAGMSLDALCEYVQSCRKCELCERRTTVVFGEGNPDADLMFVGEGPGYDEDQQGRPFVGAAGQLLTRMINAMQFSREEVYIANIVKCRPPGNRNPLPEEAETCLPYLHRQIELINPKVIVVLGAVPLQFLLNKRGIMRLRGKWDEFNGIKVMPTFHPAYLLRNAEAKKEVWEDLQQVMAVFGKQHRK